MNNNVYIFDTKKTLYDNSIYFNPSKKFSENNLEISLPTDEDVYVSFRNILINMGLDKKNIGKSSWNPFKDFIKEGDKVLIKPNLVKHINEGPGDTDCLITNISLIRPIIDYTILALNGTGKIIVGDAPVQECDFDVLIKQTRLQNLIDEYKKVFSNIELKDFRKNQNSSIECKMVQINEYSSFSELDDIEKEYSITNYNLALMNEHHKDGKHEYIIPVDVLESDVIINVPKPKTHRKAGITACMKNFVGINGNKECLPHHRTGDPSKNGDEFPEKSITKNFFSFLSKQTYRNNFLINFIRRGFSFMLKILRIGRFQEGSWYGNDTIWRTILDLNKLILYTDKNGVLQKKKQRVIFNVADMIVSGEKEGPLLPSNKEVGLLVAGFNQLNMDKVICQIMGFEPDKIKYINNGYKLDKLKISTKKKFSIFDNDNKEIKDMSKYNYNFKATDGWKDYLEENK